MMWEESFWSLLGSGLSSNRKMRSKRERMALLILMLSLSDFPFMQFPWIGLAEAMMVTLDCSWQMIPAFAMDTVCCSMASSRAEESEILSNQSIPQTPLSHRTSAPASIEDSPPSLLTVTVRPLWVITLPLTYTLFGRSSVANFSNCDFPKPGSPNIRMWLFSLNPAPLFIAWDDPPTIPKSNPAFTISCPKMVGQKDLIKEVKMKGSFLIFLMAASASSLIVYNLSFTRWLACRARDKIPWVFLSFSSFSAFKIPHALILSPAITLPTRLSLISISMHRLLESACCTLILWFRIDLTDVLSATITLHLQKIHFSGISKTPSVKQ